MAVMTSIQMPDHVHEQYETLALVTGRTRNDLMVEALRDVVEQRLREIAMIQEGIRDAEEGRGLPIDEVVARFKAEGMLPADFVLDAEEDDEQQ